MSVKKVSKSQYMKEFLNKPMILPFLKTEKKKKMVYQNVTNKDLWTKLRQRHSLQVKSRVF